MAYIDWLEWQRIRENRIRRFTYYWDEMWGYWPSSFPIRMEKEEWERQYQKWIDRGMPNPVDKYRGINDED